MKELTIEEIKQYQLDILDVVDRFCRENKIQYFLGYGSLIGAVRHNGYIPWDDDIDLMMFRKEYERFIKTFNAAHSEYQVYAMDNSAGYHFHFAKISSRKTVLIDDDLEINDIELGVNIDLFPIDECPEQFDTAKIVQRMHVYDLLIFAKSFRWSSLHKKPLRQKVLILAAKAAGLFFSKHFLAGREKKIATQFAQRGFHNCTVFSSTYVKGTLPIWDIEDFRPAEHVFEHRMYCIPEHYDKILRAEWGDYMQLPPEEKRISNHSFRAWMK